MRKAFTLIEIVIVLLVIGILMWATMRFWSNRITDLKAQTIKEQFVGRYNNLYSQNMTSSFRNGQKYEKMTVVLWQPFFYLLDAVSFIEPTITWYLLTNFRFQPEGSPFATANLVFTPYKLWCDIVDNDNPWDRVYFDFNVPENGKKYCFEIPSETCKLIETKCN